MYRVPSAWFSYCVTLKHKHTECNTQCICILCHIETQTQTYWMHMEWVTVCFQGFFRRSLKRGASYVCTREGKCDVTGERRNLCGYCRYQKCVSLGMSKTGKQVTRLTMQKNVSSFLIRISCFSKMFTSDECGSMLYDCHSVGRCFEVLWPGAVREGV